MATRGASFGMVALLVTMAIVLLLVAKRWRELAARPTALPEGVSFSHSGQTGTGSDMLPGLSEAEAVTDAHANAVGEALEASQD